MRPQTQTAWGRRPVESMKLDEGKHGQSTTAGHRPADEPADEAGAEAWLSAAPCQLGGDDRCHHTADCQQWHPDEHADYPSAVPQAGHAAKTDPLAGVPSVVLRLAVCPQQEATDEQRLSEHHSEQRPRALVAGGRLRW